MNVFKLVDIRTEASKGGKINFEKAKALPFEMGEAHNLCMEKY